MISQLEKQRDAAGPHLANDDLEPTTLLDHVLSWICTLITVYSIGNSLSLPNASIFLMVFVTGGSIFSLLVCRLFHGKRFLRADTVLYALAGILCVIFAQPLNKVLPGGPLPTQIMISSVLSWIIVIGSFFTWRDQTLIFMAVPCIALFGLVGAFETFTPGIFAFFLFLLCMATLFARMHGRAMLRMARRSLGSLAEAQHRVEVMLHGTNGSELAEEQNGKKAKARDWMREHLMAGPWRWMAGPEWALVSAAGVVIISVVGAPLVRYSASPISGNLQFTQNVQSAIQAISAANSGGSERGEFPLGRGPIGMLSETPTLSLKIDRPRYLRSRIAITYFGNSWGIDPEVRTSPPRPAMPADQEDPTFDEIIDITNPKLLDYSYVVLGRPKSMVYLAGIRQKVLSDPPMTFFPYADGSLESLRTQLEGTEIKLSVYVPPDNGEPRDSSPPLGELPDRLAEYTNASRATSRVRRFFQQAVTDAAAKTDYEKAMAIKQAIERQVRYNLLAEAIPRDQDSVDAFLFKTQEGYCDLFASAMALGARVVGLPSRTVVGFFPNDAPVNGKYIITEAHRHMWAEVHFKDYGWVPFDPTEGAASVPGGERFGSNFAKRAWFEAEYIQWIINGIVVACAAAIVLLIARFVYLRARSVGSDKLSPVQQTYTSFIRMLERRTRRPRRLSQTTSEYIDHISEQLSGGADRARELGANLEAGLFSTNQPGPETLSQYTAIIRQIDQDIKANMKKAAKE